MRILVVSDSHRDVFALRRAIEAQPKARVIIHLGDGERDMDAVSERLGDIKVVQLRGNEDHGPLTPYDSLEIVEGKRIFCTHGQYHGEREDVKYSTDELKSAARKQEADIALFGHTHVPKNEYDDGLYLFNPGSIRSGDYGVVDITETGIACIHMRLGY